MNRSKNVLLVLLLLVTSIGSHAQNDSATQVTGFMRDHGRINVVVAVMLTILVGIVLYLVRIDKKLSKLEKEG